MTYDPDDDMLARDETPELISSEKVDGTDVDNREGERLGKIHHFMVGKRDGRVHFAVMSFGGMFGLGNDYYPLPWDVLTYDTDKDGYVVEIDDEELRGAPSYNRDEEPSYDREYRSDLMVHYQIPLA